MRLDLCLCLCLDLGLRWNLKPLGTGTARAWSGHLYESFDVGRCVTVFGRTTTINSGSDRDPRHNPRIGSKTKPPSTSTSISIIIMKILLSSIPRIGMTEGKYDIGIIHGIINGEQGRSENDEIFFALETDHDLKMFGFECCNNTSILFDGMEVGFEDDGIHTTRTTALLFMFMFMLPFGLIQGSVSVAVVIIPNLNACWLEWKRGPGGCSLFVSGEGEDGCDFVELSSGGSRR